MPRRSTRRSEIAGLGAYEERLDAEIREFIAQTYAWYPPETLNLPIADQREIYKKMCSAFHCGTPEGVSSVDELIHIGDRGLPIRRYRRTGSASAAVILYYHGGGFVLGNLDSHDDVCAALCSTTGYEVISVDYRLAPEHLHPAAFDDACALFGWAARILPVPLLLMGESAGGNLAAAVAHAKRHDSHAAVGQVLIYPSLASEMQGPSYREHADAPMLNLREVKHYNRIRLGDSGSGRDPRFAPLDDTTFAGLPPTVVVTAECDPLSSDGQLYCERIRAAGGRGYWLEVAGVVHSFLRARRISRRAREAFDQIVAAAQALGRGEWPY